MAAPLVSCTKLASAVKTIEADLPSATVLYNTLKGVGEVVLTIASLDPAVGAAITGLMAAGDAAKAAGDLTTLTGVAAQLATAVEGKWTASAPA